MGTHPWSLYPGWLHGSTNVPKVFFVRHTLLKRRGDG